MLQSEFFTDEVVECHERHRKANTKPSISELSALLKSATGYFTKTIIVIDALDECHEDSRSVLIDEMNGLSKEVSLLITSRHAFNTVPGIRTDITIRLKATDADIKSYLEERVGKSRILRTQITKDPNLQGYLISSLVSKAKGM